MSATVVLIISLFGQRVSYLAACGELNVDPCDDSGCGLNVQLLQQGIGFKKSLPVGEGMSTDAVRANAQFFEIGPSRAEPSKAVSASRGCGDDAASTIVAAKQFLVHDGFMREYIIRVPSTYSHNVPHGVLFLFHAAGGNISETRESIADASGQIVVLPQGLGTKPQFNGAGSSMSPGPDGPTCKLDAVRPTDCHASCGMVCDPCWYGPCTDDVGFTLALLDLVEAQYCINKNKVAAMGTNIVYSLAIDPRSSDRFDAVGATLSLPHTGFLSLPPNGKLPRLMAMWGGLNKSYQDPVYPPIANTPGRADRSLSSQGGYYYTTAAETEKFWMTDSRCDGTQSTPLKVQLLRRSTEVGGKAQDIHCDALCGGRVFTCFFTTDVHAENFPTIGMPALFAFLML